MRTVASMKAIGESYEHVGGDREVRMGRESNRVWAE